MSKQSDIKQGHDQNQCPKESNRISWLEKCLRRMGRALHTEDMVKYK